MKKKLTAIALVVCMLAVMLVGASLAYFTDKDEATNTFVVGNVKIEQNEWQRGKVTNKETGKEEDGIVAFVQNQKVMPAVLDKLTKSPVTVDGYEFNIRSKEGNYIDKIVNVKNTGTEKAYMRTIIAIPDMNGYDDDGNATENPLHWNYLDSSDFENTGWDWDGKSATFSDGTTDKVAAVTIDGKQYDLYVATHNKPVEAGATTAPSMVGFYLDDDVNCDEKGYYSMQNGKRIDLSGWMTAGQDGKVTLKILVATQACQTEGFADAWTALDTCFGDITATNHPWYTAE